MEMHKRLTRLAARKAKFHPFQTPHDMSGKCMDCGKPKTARVHWEGDGPMPDDRSEESDTTLDGSGGRRSGAGIYQPFDWEQ